MTNRTAATITAALWVFFLAFGISWSADSRLDRTAAAAPSQVEAQAIEVAMNVWHAR